ncbi:PucR family transcriptional regulator [Vibrio salinus]|uniref:PucR family transcriptional regulator n=1 Tax=Vibrio salinus TaxID=2899784 RepID=UPI001E2D8148|nr:PucR family transcriptional regulator [Vibrio salinus]MCE0495685.1 PucR family transcriptional regulator [Vibrio salinus]
MLTVRDIPNIQGLSDIKIIAGQNHVENRIRWPYVAEEYQLEPWLKGGEVVFITGINRCWYDDDFSRLIDILKLKNAAAVIVLTGSKHIPSLKQSWRDLCDEKQVPLLEQPYHLPMVTVTERISNAIIQDTFSQRSKQWFIQQLIDARLPSENTTIDQAGQMGFPTDVNLSVALVLPGSEPDTNTDAWYFALCEFLTRHKSPFPVIEYRAGWILCLPQLTTDPLPYSIEIWEELQFFLKSHQFEASIGVSDGSRIEYLPRMVSEARQSAAFASQHIPGQVHHYQSFGLQRLFASVEDTDLLYDFCRRYLGDCFLCQEEELVTVKQTMIHYFNNLCSLRKTAESLNIHRNTVTHRLNKFKSLTHLSLNEPNTRLCVQNALLMEAFILPKYDKK